MMNLTEREQAKIALAISAPPEAVSYENEEEAEEAGNSVANEQILLDEPIDASEIPHNPPADDNPLVLSIQPGHLLEVTLSASPEESTLPVPSPSSDSGMQQRHSAQPTSADELPEDAPESIQEQQPTERLLPASNEQPSEVSPSDTPGVLLGVAPESSFELLPESTLLASTDQSSEIAPSDTSDEIPGIKIDEPSTKLLPESTSLASFEPQFSEAARLPSSDESFESASRASTEQTQEGSSFASSAKHQQSAVYRNNSSESLRTNNSNSNSSESRSSSAENILDGVRVLRRFAGFGDFWGAVAGSRMPDGSRTWYRVEYDDGDSEEYNFKEIQRMAEQAASRAAEDPRGPTDPQTVAKARQALGLATSLQTFASVAADAASAPPLKLPPQPPFISPPGSDPKSLPLAGKPRGLLANPGMSNLLLNVPPQNDNGDNGRSSSSSSSNNSSNNNNSHKSRKGGNSSNKGNSSSGSSSHGTDDRAYELRVAEMSLRGMGFPQQDVLVALAQHGPDQTRCIEHLLTLTGNSSPPNNESTASAATVTNDSKAPRKASSTPPLPGTNLPSLGNWTTEPPLRSKRAAAVVAAHALISTNHNPLKQQPTPLLSSPRPLAPAAAALSAIASVDETSSSSPLSPTAKRSKQSSPSLASTSYVKPHEHQTDNSSGNNGDGSDKPLDTPSVELFPCQLCSTGIEAELLLICDGCEAEVCLACAGLKKIPPESAAWFCGPCRAKAKAERAAEAKAAAKAERAERYRADKEKADKAKAEKAESDTAASEQEKADLEKAEKARISREKAAKTKAEKAEKAKAAAAAKREKRAALKAAKEAAAAAEDNEGMSEEEGDNDDDEDDDKGDSESGDVAESAGVTSPNTSREAPGPIVAAGAATESVIAAGGHSHLPPPPLSLATATAQAAATAAAALATLTSASAAAQPSAKDNETTTRIEDLVFPVLSGKTRPAGCTALFVGNWNFDAKGDRERDAEVQAFFAGCGALASIRWLFHKKTNAFKGCGFVQFAGDVNVAAGALSKAATKNGERIRGKPVRLEYPDPKSLATSFQSAEAAAAAGVFGWTPPVDHQPRPQPLSSSPDALLSVEVPLEKQPLPPVGQPLTGGTLDDEALDFGAFEWDFAQIRDDATGAGSGNQGSSARVHDNKRTRRKERGRQRYLEAMTHDQDGEGEWVPENAFSAPDDGEDADEDADAAARMAGLLAALPERVSVELTDVLEANQWLRVSELEDQVLASLALLPEAKALEMLSRVAQAGSRLAKGGSSSSVKAPNAGGKSPGSLLLNTLVRTFVNLTGLQGNLNCNSSGNGTGGSSGNSNHPHHHQARRQRGKHSQRRAARYQLANNIGGNGRSNANLTSANNNRDRSRSSDRTPSVSSSGGTSDRQHKRSASPSFDPPHRRPSSFSDSPPTVAPAGTSAPGAPSRFWDGFKRTERAVGDTARGGDYTGSNGHAALGISGLIPRKATAGGGGASASSLSSSNSSSGAGQRDRERDRDRYRDRERDRDRDRDRGSDDRDRDYDRDRKQARRPWGQSPASGDSPRARDHHYGSSSKASNQGNSGNFIASGGGSSGVGAAGRADRLSAVLAKLHGNSSSSSSSGSGSGSSSSSSSGTAPPPRNYDHRPPPPLHPPPPMQQYPPHLNPPPSTGYTLHPYPGAPPPSFPPAPHHYAPPPPSRAPPPHAQPLSYGRPPAPPPGMGLAHSNPYANNSHNNAAADPRRGNNSDPRQSNDPAAAAAAAARQQRMQAVLGRLHQGGQSR